MTVSKTHVEKTNNTCIPSVEGIRKCCTEASTKAYKTLGITPKRMEENRFTTRVTLGPGYPEITQITTIGNGYMTFHSLTECAVDPSGIQQVTEAISEINKKTPIGYYTLDRDHLIYKSSRIVIDEISPEETLKYVKLCFEAQKHIRQGRVGEIIVTYSEKKMLLNRDSPYLSDNRKDTMFR